jgi:hypothetical protein
MPLQRTVAPPPCLPLDMKEDTKFFDGGFWLAAYGLLVRLLQEWQCWCSSWVMLEIRGNMGQWKSEHRDFKKAKERTWDSVSLREETLKNRKEARF